MIVHTGLLLQKASTIYQELAVVCHKEAAPVLCIANIPIHESTRQTKCLTHPEHCLLYNVMKMRRCGKEAKECSRLIPTLAFSGITSLICLVYRTIYTI